MQRGFSTPDGREHKLEQRGHPARTRRTATSFQNLLEANTLAIEESHQNRILETCLGKYLSIYHGSLKKHNKRWAGMGREHGNWEEGERDTKRTVRRKRRRGSHSISKD